MLFCNINLNLKQSRISLKIPKINCKNKINLEVKNDGEIVINQIYELTVGSNLKKFSLNPLSLRQFNYSKTEDLFYNLNFIIDCDFEFSCLDEKCTIRMPSDDEMAIDWAYCCGDNQEKHFQNLKSDNLDKQEKATNSSKDLSNLDDLNEFFILMTKQKLFAKLLIESTNRTEYLILHKLNNRCLIAFDETDEENCSQSNPNGLSKNFELKESIFVEFIYLDYEQEAEEVKKYRHSFEYEFMRLDCQLFYKLFKNLYGVNKSILPLVARFNPLTKFNYSYLFI